MPVESVPGGAGTHPGLAKDDRADPTVGYVSSQDRMLVAPADEVQPP